MRPFTLSSSGPGPFCPVMLNAPWAAQNGNFPRGRGRPSLEPVLTSTNTFAECRRQPSPRACYFTAEKDRQAAWLGHAWGLAPPGTSVS